MEQVAIGKFIAKKRKEQNLTQEQLAERLGVSNKTISKWETGKCMPDYTVIKSLCGELKVTVSELMDAEETEGKSVRVYDDVTHDALDAGSEFFERFALLDEFEDCFQQSLGDVHLVHCLTSFCKSFASLPYMYYYKGFPFICQHSSLSISCKFENFYLTYERISFILCARGCIHGYFNENQIG